MTPFAVAGIQMEVHLGRDNLIHIGAELRHLMRNFPWVQMVLLSELAPSGGMSPKQAHELPGPLEESLQELAAQHGVWFIPGSIYERVEGKVYNTCPVIAPSGELVGRYRKQFPFLPYEQGVTGGDRPFAFDVPGVGRFGLSICYDLWFPETARALVADGVEVVLHPSLTDTVDRPIELSIIRAMAAINQVYVLDVNGLADGGVGRSLFVGPAGDTLHQAGTTEELIAFEIDLDRVRRSREVGLRGLGQPLKSFRDRTASFGFYADGQRSAYLDSLGPLVKPQRGSRVGLDRLPPGEGAK
ncbi:MAG: carbon-nitrogen hydrolase family protein [Planctomycetota bacterium]